MSDARLNALGRELDALASEEARYYADYEDRHVLKEMDEVLSRLLGPVPTKRRSEFDPRRSSRES